MATVDVTVIRADGTETGEAVEDPGEILHVEDVRYRVDPADASVYHEETPADLATQAAADLAARRHEWGPTP